MNAQLLGQSTSSVKGRNGGEKQAPREGQREERVTKGKAWLSRIPGRTREGFLEEEAIEYSFERQQESGAGTLGICAKHTGDKSEPGLWKSTKQPHQC